MGNICTKKFGHKLTLPEPVNVEFSKKEAELAQEQQEFKTCKKKYDANIEDFRKRSTGPNAMLSSLYTSQNLNPFFHEALMEAYGDLYTPICLETKNQLYFYYKKYYDAEQTMRELLNPQDVSEPSCPLEFPKEYLMSEKENELLKLTTGPYRIEGGKETLGEPVFRSFYSFGNFADISEAITKDELKQMLRNLGAGNNVNDDEDITKSNEIREKNLAGFKAYKKVLQKHYAAMFTKYGDVENLLFEDRLSRQDELSSAFSNMQVDNHWVDRFSQLFDVKEDELLVNAIHYYNLTSAFMIINEKNIEQLGFDEVKVMDTDTRRFFTASNTYKEFKVALFEK